MAICKRVIVLHHNSSLCNAVLDEFEDAIRELKWPNHNNFIIQNSHRIVTSLLMKYVGLDYDVSREVVSMVNPPLQIYEKRSEFGDKCDMSLEFIPINVPFNADSIVSFIANNIKQMRDCNNSNIDSDDKSDNESDLTALNSVKPLCFLHLFDQCEANSIIKSSPIESDDSSDSESEEKSADFANDNSDNSGGNGVSVGDRLQSQNGFSVDRSIMDKFGFWARVCASAFDHSHHIHLFVGSDERSELFHNYTYSILRRSALKWGAFNIGSISALQLSRHRCIENSTELYYKTSAQHLRRHYLNDRDSDSDHSRFLGELLSTIYFKAPFMCWTSIVKKVKLRLNVIKEIKNKCRKNEIYSKDISKMSDLFKHMSQCCNHNTINSVNLYRVSYAA